MKYIYWLFICSTLISCTKHQLPNDPREHFSKSIYLKPTKIIELEKYDILTPVKVVMYKDWYVFRERSNMNNNCVKFLSTDFSKMIMGVNQGNGPLDVVGRFGLEVIEDSLYAIDFNHRKLLTLDVCNDSVSISVKSLNCHVGTTALPIDKEHYLGYAAQDSCMYKLTSLEGKIYSEIDYVPNTSLSEFEYQAQNSVYLNTNFAKSPNSKKFAFGVLNATMFGFGEIINNDSLKLNTFYEYSPMKIANAASYQNDIYSSRISLKNDNITNVVSCVGTDDNVVFAYSGFPINDMEHFGSCLLIYDWDGNPIVRAEIDDNITNLFYDVKKDLLIALSFVPEARLVVYDMKDIE